MSANYEPMSEVRKTFKVAWYRCPIERAKAAGVRHVIFNSALGADQNEAAPLRCPIEPATLRMLTKRSDLKGWLRHDLLLQPRIDHP